MSALYHVRLSEPEQRCLRQMISSGKSAASTLVHARILLKADKGPGAPSLPDRQVAEAEQIRRLVEERYSGAEKILLVLDNLNTHGPGSLYEAFAPELARRLVEKLEFHHTPKHGSWLNMAEIELSVLSRQCLARRIPEHKMLAHAVNLWETGRNQTANAIDWRFTTEGARIKLKRLYSKYN